MNGYDLGSTSGGCTVKKMPSGRYVVETYLQTLTDEHMRLFGFEQNSNGFMQDTHRTIALDSLVVCGAGPDCSCRTMYFENPKVNCRCFEYTISKDDLTAVKIQFTADSMGFSTNNINVECKQGPPVI